MGPWSVPLGFVRRGCRLPCGRHGESPHPRRGESWLMSFALGPLVRTRLTQREGSSRASHGQGNDSQATDMPSILCSLKAPYGGKAMCQSASGAPRDQLNPQCLPRELDQSRIQCPSARERDSRDWSDSSGGRLTGTRDGVRTQGPRLVGSTRQPLSRSEGLPHAARFPLYLDFIGSFRYELRERMNT